MKNKRNTILKRTGILILFLMIPTLLGSVQNTTSLPEWDSGAWQEIAFNCKHPILSDPLIRRALSHLADREATIEMGASQIGVLYPGITFVNPTSYGFDSSIQYDEYNSNYALQLIRSAGYSVEELSFTILTPSTNQHRINWTEMFAENLRQIGIAVDHVVTDWGEIISRTFGHPALFDNDPSTIIPAFDEGGYDMFAVGYGFALENDVVYWTGDTYVHEESFNFYQYNNENYENLYFEVQAVGSGSADSAIFSEIQQILKDDPPAIILFQGLYTDDIEFETVTEGLNLLLDEVSGLEVSGDISAGSAESLLAKLDAATNHWNNGKDLQTAHHLDVFIKHVQVLLESESIPYMEGQYLIYVAQLIINKILV